MLDASPVQMQRARGRASVALSLRGGATRLDRLHQSGCAKAFLPKVHSDVPEVVFLNTSGGLTGGDKLSFRGDLGAGVSATLTTQTAERAYASADGVAEMDVEISVRENGHLAWLPQETILFDHSGLRRRTTIRLGAGATCLSVETLVLGRAAMGEVVSDLNLFDSRVIERNGLPLVIDPVRLNAETLTAGSPAGLSGARALTSLIWVSDAAADWVDRLRATIAQHPVEAAVSAWDGRLVVRGKAVDAYPLRRMVADVIVQIQDSALPRVWQV